MIETLRPFGVLQVYRSIIFRISIPDPAGPSKALLPRSLRTANAKVPDLTILRKRHTVRPHILLLFTSRVQ